MEEITTQDQLGVFLDLFHQCTATVNTALYCAGIFCGAVVFPIYAVILMRRRTRKYMDRVLSEISDRDPWLWATLRGKNTFDTEKPFEWIQDLCRWQARYQNVKVFFGAPDLEAKCIQATKALVNVFLSWSSDLRDLPAAQKGRLTQLLLELKARSAEPDIDKLLTILTSPDDPFAWIRALDKKAEEVRSWFDFLEGLDVPSDLAPAAAATHGEMTREKLALALLVLARPNCPILTELTGFFRTVNSRGAGPLRIAAIHVDKALGMEGKLVDELKDLLEGSPQLRRLRDHPVWRKFVLAFGKTPLAALECSGTDDFAALRERHRQVSAKLQGESADRQRQVKRLKEINLAWETIQVLHEEGMLTLPLQPQ